MGTNLKEHGGGKAPATDNKTDFLLPEIIQPLENGVKEKELEVFFAVAKKDNTKWDIWGDISKKKLISVFAIAFLKTIDDEGKDLESELKELAEDIRFVAKHRKPLTAQV